MDAPSAFADGNLSMPTNTGRTIPGKPLPQNPFDSEPMKEAYEKCINAQDDAPSSKVFADKWNPARLLGHLMIDLQGLSVVEVVAEDIIEARDLEAPASFFLVSFIKTCRPLLVPNASC
jgi:hypothetical protein